MRTVQLVFDQSIGQVFVACIAGNIATSEIIASLEYGVAALGTKVIIVLGRRNCGAVKATIKGKGEPGQISALYPAYYATGRTHFQQPILGVRVYSPSCLVC